MQPFDNLFEVLLVLVAAINIAGLRLVLEY